MTMQMRRYPTAADFDKLFEVDSSSGKIQKIFKRLTAGMRPSGTALGVDYAACWNHLVGRNG